MYTQEDINAVQAQYKKRLLYWLMPAILILILVIFSFVYRVQWLTITLFALMCAYLLFTWSLLILPVRSYRIFLQNAVHGRNRQDKLRFDSIAKDTVTREGARFYPVTLRADTLKEEMDERSFYWDANLPLPPWQKGDMLDLRSHEKMITGWQRAGEQ